MNGNDNQNNGNDDFFGPVIFSYTREQAIDDGVLVDVSYMAREVGITFPTAVTSAVWDEYVKVPEIVPWQDEQGRLWDILWMLRMAIQRSKGSGELVRYKLLVQNDEGPAKEVELKAQCGPGDKGEPVITIMKPNED